MLLAAAFILCSSGAQSQQCKHTDKTWQACVWYQLWRVTRVHSVFRTQTGNIHPPGHFWHTTSPSSCISLNRLHLRFQSLSGNDACESEKLYLGPDYSAGGFRPDLCDPEWWACLSLSLRGSVISPIGCCCLTWKCHSKEWWISGISQSSNNILWVRWGSTSIISLRCICSDPDRL